MINYLAVLLCGIAAIVIGFVWFGPLFGKTWMQSAFGGAPDSATMAEGKKKMPMNAFIQFVLALAMAFVLARAIAVAGATEGIAGIPAGIHFAFWNWLGFVVPSTVGLVLWEGKPWKYWIIIAGSWLVTMLAMGLILGALPA